MVSPQATQDDNSSHPNDWKRGDKCPCTAQDLCHCDGALIEDCGCYRHELAAQERRETDSVRITAQDRRRIVADFLAGALVVQRAVTEGERIDRAAKGSASPLGLFTTDDLRVSNAAAVQQWIASNLTAVSDNRDFTAVAK